MIFFFINVNINLTRAMADSWAMYLNFRILPETIVIVQSNWNSAFLIFETHRRFMVWWGCTCAMRSASWPFHLQSRFWAQFGTLKHRPVPPLFLLLYGTKKCWWIWLDYLLEMADWVSKNFGDMKQHFFFYKQCRSFTKLSKKFCKWKG